MEEKTGSSKVRILNKTEDEVEVEFENKGKKEKVKLGKLTFGERKELMKKTMKVIVEGGEPKVNFDMAEYYELVLFMSIKESSFTKTIDYIRGLPEDIAMELSKIANELNPFRF